MMLSAVAVDDELMVGLSSQTVIINPLANDSTTHTPLQIVSFTQPSVGSVTLVDGNVEQGGTVVDRLVYHRPAGYSGNVSFSYTIEDSLDHQDTADVTISLQPDETVDLPFDSLTGWTVVESGGSGTVGSVTTDNGDLVIHEGNSFLVSLERNLVIPANPGRLTFQYDTTFDTTDPDSINDAFEVALVDSQGRTVVQNIRPGRDSFLNETEGEATALGSWTTLVGQTATLDISALPAGETYHVILRLVNNDSDTGTTVRLISTNHLPIANSDTYSTTKGIAVTKNSTSGVLANDTDADQDAFTAQLIQGPANGTLTFNSNGSFTYTPTSTFVGTDTFTYYAVETTGGAASLPTTVFIQVGPDSYEIPGEPGTLTVLTLSIEAVNIEASYHNELGIYLVDNAAGEVNGILPGQSGYVSAALNSPTRQIVFARPVDNEDLIGQTYQVVLPAGTRIAFYLVQNQTTAYFLSHNPSNNINTTPLTFFSFGAADPDTFQHFKHTAQSDGSILYQVEDLTGGGDQDYNDLQFTVSTEPTEVVGPIKFFVTDAQSDRVYEYNPTGYWVGQPQLDAANGTSRGITSNTTGSRRWVVNSNGHVFVYDDEMALVGDWQASGISSATGIGTDGTDLWIVDDSLDKVFFFDNGAALTTGTVSATSNFSLNSANTTASDLMTNGSTIWVTDSGTDKVYLYNTSGTLQGSWQLSSANSDASGITYDPTGGSDDLWVVDRVDRVVYRYQHGTTRTSSTGPVAATDTFALATPNTAPEGIADPLAVTVSTSANQGVADPNGHVLISGQAISDSGRITHVTINGVEVEVLDVAGNFFSEVPVLPGQNSYTIESHDSASQSASTIVNITGATSNTSGIDFSVVLPAISQGIIPEYGMTSFNERLDVLYADVALRNTGTFAVSGPLLVGVRNISAPRVTVVNADGWTPGADGIPYYDFSDLIGPDGTLSVDELSAELSLAFHNPDRVKFTYELVIFGAVNQPPQFTTVPVIEGIVGGDYLYDSLATDPDGDTLAYSLLSGPDGLAVATNGQVTWSPDSSDVGTHVVSIQVSDGRGGVDIQNYVISVRSNIPNRPPRFTSTPVIDAYVNVEYDYPSVAVDPDQDDLTYSLTDGPAGMDIDPDTGEIEWTPSAALVGQTVSVTIKADDGHGASGGGIAEQTYLVYVHPQPGNAPPIIVSNPSTTHVVPGFPGTGSGDVTPTTIDLELGEGATAIRNVTITLPEPGGGDYTAYADIVLVIDESGSMEEQSWIATLVEDLEEALLAVGIGTTTGYANRYGLIGFGAASPVPRAILLGTSHTYFGTYLDVVDVVDEIQTSGSEEDGYAGIDFALDYPFRSGAARNIILITDEDRDDLGSDGLPTYQNILDELEENHALLNVVVNAGFSMPVPPVARLSGSASIAAFGSASLYATGSSDPDGGAIASYSWDLNGDGVYGDGGLTTGTLSLSWSTLASYGFAPGASRMVGVRVTDNEGDTDTARWAINVGDTSPPVASLGGSASIPVFNSLSLYASGSDPDGGSIVSYSWDLNDDGTFGDGSYTSSSLTLPWSTLTTYGFSAEASRTVAVRITDNEGETDIAKFSVNVGPTYAPTASLGGNSSIAVFGSLSLYASGSDPDGGSISSYSWDLNNDGTFGDGSYTSSSLTLNWSTLTSFGFAAGGSYTVGVRVTDNEGVTDVAKFAVNVGPTYAPTASLGGNTSIAAFASLSLYASGSDPDGGSISSYSWDLNNDGTFGDGSYTSNSLTLSWSTLTGFGFAAGGSYTVGVRVTDNEGETDVAKFAVNVGPTSAPIAYISGPTSMSASNNLFLSASGTDPDGGSMSAYSWDLNGDGTFGDGSYTTSSLNLTWSTLTSFGFAAGGMYTVAVRVTDNEGDTDIAKWAVNVADTSPHTVAAFDDEESVSSISAFQSLWISAGASYDPDGGALTAYTWDLNGDGTFGDGSYTSSSLNLSWSTLASFGFTPGSSRTITVKVTDNETDTDTAKWAVNVGPTSLPVASFDDEGTPTSMNAFASLSIYASGSDPDGGSITGYTWDLNNDGTFGDGGYTSSYLTLSWSTLTTYGFAPGSSNTIAVKITDNEGDTDIAKWAINVGTTSLPVASFDDEGTATSMNAFASLSIYASGSDPDGGSITGYTWDLNGDGAFGDGGYTASYLTLSWSTLTSYGFAPGSSNTIAVKVTDNEGDTDIAKWAVNVGTTSLPVASFDDEGTSSSMNPFNSLSIYAYGSDPDGGSITGYTWDLNNDGTFGDGGYTSSYLTLSWSTLTSYGFAPDTSRTIAVKVTDNEGDIDVAKWSVNVGPTKVPVVSFDDESTQFAITAGNALSIYSYASDPDGGSITGYTWDLNGDGTYGDGGYTTNYLNLSWSTLASLGFEAGGSYPIKVKVTDNEGEIKTALMVVNVDRAADTTALGVDSEGVAYAADGSGGFISGDGGGYTGGFETTKTDYVDLAWDTGGAAWNILLLRDGGLDALSFTEAFVEVKKSEILHQVQEINVNVVASNGTSLFENQTGVITAAQLGTQIDFDVEFTGNGAGQAYLLQFVQQGTGVVLGSIPVTINNDYFYLVQAVDPDGDALTYSLVDGPAGAVMDPITARITWEPPAAGDYPFKVRVADGRGGVDEQDFVVTVTTSGAGNDPPVIDTIPDFDGQVGRAFEQQVVATDPDGDFLKYYLTTAPAGMAINVDSGLITWTPTVGQENIQHTVTVKVFDRRGGSDTETFVVDVAPAAVFVNSVPEITSLAPTSAVTGVHYHYSATATDLDGDDLTWSLTLGPAGAGIDPQTGDIVWTPTDDQVGAFSFAVQVRDSHGGSDYQYFVVDVSSTNSPPTITSQPTGPASTGKVWNYQLTATDPNGDVLQYVLNPSSVVGNMAINSSTGLLTWTPAAAGQYRIEVFVIDNRGGYDVQSFTLPVTSNAAPRITSQPPAVATVGTQYSYTIAVTDPDGDSYTVSLDADSLARGIALAGNVLTWTSQTSGDFPITITATDVHGAASSQSFTLPVRPAVVASEPPVITSHPTGPAYVGQAWTYIVTATDSDDDPEDLVYTLESPATSAQIAWNGTTHTLTWTPQSGDVATGKTFTVKVTDAAGSFSRQTFNVPAETSAPAGAPPKITSIPTGPAINHQLYEYQVEAYDPNGDTLAYSLVSPPTGVHIDPATGLLTFTPGTTGNVTIQVRVDDNRDGYATQTFTLPVVNPPTAGANIPPEITSRPSGPAFVGQAWQYVIDATDLDGDEADLVYSLITPTGNGQVSFNPTTHTLTWNPTATGTLTFTVRVTDGDSAYTEQTFEVPAVTAPTNAAPRIRSLAPNPVRLGDTYVYQVDAYDPNGDTLTYSLQTKPVGMTIDAQTGLVTWNPSKVGSYSVVIAVSDGVNSPVLQSFTLDAIAPVKVNDPPHITSEPTGPAVRDRAYRYQATATDPDGDTIAWSLDQDSIDRGITIGSTTGLLAWTPSTAGSFTIKVTATDSHGASETQTFTLPVLRNAPPVITSPAVTQVNLGQSYAYDVNATDPNSGDTLKYSLAEAPEGMAIDDDTGEIDWEPTVAGVYTVTVVVKDQDDAQTSQTYQLRVIDTSVNIPPLIHSTLRSQTQVGQRLLHQVDATDADGDPLTYSLVGAPTGMTIDNAGLIDWTPAANQVSSTPYTFTLRVNDGRSGGLVEAAYSITVINQPVNHAPAFTSEPRTNLVAGVRYTYDADATDPDGDTLIYSLTQAPSGMTINPLTGLVTWTPAIENIGTHTMTVRVMDTLGQGAEQTVTLTVRAVNRPPMFMGDPPTTAIRNEQLVYQVQASDPDGHRLTYALGLGTTASGSIAINSTTGVITWTPNTASAQFIQVNIVDELGLGISVTFRVDVLASRPNTSPNFTNAPGLEASINTTYSWNADATDPDAGDTVSFQLTGYSVPGGTVSFNTTSGLLQWAVPNTSGLIGQYGTFEVRAVDSLGAYQSRRFSVLITAQNVAPVITTIPNQTISAGASYRYDVDASDGNNDPLTYSLDAASVALGMTIDQYGRISWSPDAGDISGTPYTVTVTVADDRGLNDTDDYTLLVEADDNDPTVTIVREQTQAPVGANVDFVVHAIDDVGVVSRTLTLVSVTTVSGTTTLNQSIPLSADGRGRLTLLASYVGTLTFTATATDAAGNVGQATNVTITVFDPSDANPPTARILSLTDGQVITAPVDIVGTVTDNIPSTVTWQLIATPLDGGDTKQIANGSGAVTAATLTHFDPTLLRNGDYRIDLIATDQGNNKTTDSVTIKIDGGLKLGNFTVSFTDLQVPVAGIPITLTRTYDTLNADVQGDFGYGWSFDLSNTKVKVQLPSGSDPGLFGYTPFTDGTRVVITLPDGTKEGFTFYGGAGTTLFGTVLDYVPKFRPDYGVTSELIVGGGPFRKEYATGEYYDLESGRTYSPQDPYFGGSYTLKLRNGTQLIINAETGDLYQVEDRTGNTLTFTGMGIESSGGRSIQFERDYANRITAVIDPAGNRIEYDYDPQGNLIAVTDRVGSTTNFKYLDSISAPDHYLDQIIDPLGRSAAKTEYDSAGRLKRLVDASGRTIEYSWNGESKIQLIRDQLGNTTTIETDPRGNVVREVDPVGKTILRTYDLQDRLLTETMVVGEVDSIANGETDDLASTNVYNSRGDLIESTDAHGRKTRLSYNEFGQLLSSTDAFGNTTVNHYDSRGRLNTTTDPLGNSITFAYDNEGNPTSARNSTGVLLSNSYNEFGDITQATPVAGRTSYFDYDLNGNRVATWYFDGTGPSQVQMLTVTRYDDANRTTGTIHASLPNGQFITQNLASATIPSQFVTTSTSIEYDLAGNVTATVDEYGLRAEYIYDYRDLQIQSRVQSRDSDGTLLWLVTRSVYDAAGRVIATSESTTEGASAPIEGTLYSYDAAGRVEEIKQVLGLVIDINGSGALRASTVRSPGTSLTSATTTYDTLGRIVTKLDMYDLQTEYTYNDLGDVVQTRSEVIDEFGEKVWMVSRVVYDTSGRVILATDRYLEASSDPIFGTETVYDASGREIYSIRRASVVVDLVGGSTQVSSRGSELWRTQTIYNAKGQAVRSIGPTGQTATIEYDQLGREIASLSHPLPLAEVGLAGHSLASGVNPAISVQLRTEKSYDALGRVYQTRTNIRQFIRADGSVTIDDSDAQITTYEFDARGNQVKTIFDDGTYISATYDDYGRKTSERNQYGQVRTLTYDDQGRLTTVELPSVLNPATGQMEQPQYHYGYDARGRQTLLVDPLGRETRWTFDDQGRQTGRTLPLGFGVDGIDGTGDDGAVNPNDWTEHTEYDNLGRQTLSISFEGAVTQFVYDQYGRLNEQRFFASLSAYDNGEGTPAEVWVNTEDAFGRQIRVERKTLNGSGTVIDTKTTTYEYDPEGRVTQVSGPEGTVSYTYDSYGRKTATMIGTVVDPERITSYAYDAFGRLKSVTEDRDPDSTSDQLLNTVYRYDLAGNLDRVDLPNGVIEDYAYDTLNRLSTVTQYAPDSTPENLSNNTKVAQYAYTVRADGVRTGVSESFWTSAGVVTNAITWTYDGLNRLLTEDFNSSADTTDFLATYVYDLAGNRLSKTVDLGRNGTVDAVTTSTYDANDRLLTERLDVGTISQNDAGDTFTAYAYDKTQQTKKTVHDNAGGSQTSGAKLSEFTYSYDLQGRMAVVVNEQLTGGVVTRRERTSYDYDATGTRVSAKYEIDANADGTYESSTTTEFLTDHFNFTGYSQTIRETTRDAAGHITETIDYTFGHDEISQTTRTYDASGDVISEETLVLGHDGHGSVRVVTDLAGALAQFFSFDAYGQLLAIFNQAGSILTGGNGQLADAKQALTSLLYSGESFDAAIGQQYLRARWYDPSTGRFNRLDPFFGNQQDPQSFHKYLYTHANPINGIDPTGQFLGGAVGMAMSINLHLPTIVEGSLILLTLSTIGTVGGDIRRMGMEAMAEGDLDGGFVLTEIGNQILGAALYTVEVISDALGLFQLSLAVIGFVRAIPSMAKFAKGMLFKNARAVAKVKAANPGRVATIELPILDQCFAPDTPVLTPSGFRPISEIEVGDTVLSFDFERGDWNEDIVERRHDNTYRGPVVTIETERGTITTTAYHPFWVVEGYDLEERTVPRELRPDEDTGKALAGRWINSHELRAGDWIATKDGPERLLRIEQRFESAFRVCNLTVTQRHNFAVGFAKALVHNTVGCLLLVGDAARTALRNALPTNPYPVPCQAHHLFPVELFDTPLGQKLHKWGIDLNGIDNGVNLPTIDYPGRVASIHRGRSGRIDGPGSIKYSQEVVDRLKDVADATEARTVLNQIKDDLLNGRLKINGAE